MDKEVCTKYIYVDIYAKGHLIEFPQIPVFIGLVNGRYFTVIHSMTLYPLSLSDNEVEALALAMARKTQDAKTTVVSEELKLGYDTWNWGDLILTTSNGSIKLLKPEALKLQPFKSVNSTSNIFEREDCIITFTQCMDFPPYTNVKLCTRSGFHYFAIQKGDNYYIVQSPLLLEKLRF